MDTLPQDVFIVIFKLLGSRSICTIRQVCKSWVRISKDGNLWNFYYRTRWKNTYKVHVDDWEKLYYDAFISDSRFLKGSCSVKTFEGHFKGVNTVQFRDNIIISGGRDGCIIKHDSDGRVNPVRCMAHKGEIRCLQFNNRFIISASGIQVCVWSLDTLDLIKEIRTEGDHGVSDLGFSDELQILAVLKTYSVSIYDLNTFDLIRTAPTHITAYAMQFDRWKVVVGGKQLWEREGAVEILDMQTLQQKTMFSAPKLNTVLCLQYDDDILVAGHEGSEGKVSIWDLMTG
eukprot:TRINITY_DN9936_c0_g1_i2.p1 TRINITY_DN9936_c0_g1~~TRINITY_DN9936_c0_g1_i2.p1  ORF type:complete len:287 (-),score=16.55 TRINITY_DN9936_c0_g1_i2:53-913(-)